MRPLMHPLIRPICSAFIGRLLLLVEDLATAKSMKVWKDYRRRSFEIFSVYLSAVARLQRKAMKIISSLLAIIFDLNLLTSTAAAMSPEPPGITIVNPAERPEQYREHVSENRHGTNTATSSANNFGAELIGGLPLRLRPQIQP